MSVDGFCAQKQRLADVLAGQPPRQQGQDLTLTPRQIRERVVFPVPLPDGSGHLGLQERSQIAVALQDRADASDDGLEWFVLQDTTAKARLEGFTHERVRKPSRQQHRLGLRSVPTATSAGRVEDDGWRVRSGSGGGAADQDELTADRLAEAAGLPLRKTRVIASLLASVGLLQPGRVLRLATDAPADEQIAHAENLYRERADADRERLDTLMHYAQSPRCRMMILREYFGEEAVEPCDRCDNCRVTPISNRQTELEIEGQRAAS
jgi:hypothetical protein